MLNSNSNDTLKILVTAVSGGSIGEQVCKCLHLSSLDVFLITANIDTSQASQNVTAASARVTLPRANSPEYLGALLAVVQRHSIQFIVPGSEVELGLLVQHEHLLRAAGATLLANSSAAVSVCLDKQKFTHFLCTNGFRTPKQWQIPLSEANAPQPDEFPVVVKPMVGGGGSAMTFLAQDRFELEFFTKYLCDSGFLPVLQEYVGPATQEYTVGVLHSLDGKHLGTVVLRRDILTSLSNRIRIRNRSGRSDLGDVLAISSGITQGEIVAHDEVASTSLRLATSLGSCGPLNIQGRWDGTEFIPFEANPRFSGSSPMRAMAGFNELEILIRRQLDPEYAAPESVMEGSFSRGLVESVRWSGMSSRVRP